tara:strand:+ start:89 stop:478 length:390 start_codon:yes stop_codon:yes gene_type:complete
MESFPTMHPACVVKQIVLKHQVFSATTQQQEITNAAPCLHAFTLMGLHVKIVDVEIWIALMATVFKRTYGLVNNTPVAHLPLATSFLKVLQYPTLLRASVVLATAMPLPQKVCSATVKIQIHVVVDFLK